MKCLLLVYGEDRSADVATQTWNILNNDVDVVIRTQNESNHYSEALRKQHDNHKIVKNDITKIFGDCEIHLEPLDEWTRDNPNNDRNLNIRDFRYLYKRQKTHQTYMTEFLNEFYDNINLDDNLELYFN